jgi:transcriptional regulator of met regulon
MLLVAEGSEGGSGLSRMVRKTGQEINPSYGNKGDFRKITATIPQDIYERLIQESARRKIAGQSNQLLSALLREALVEYLERLDGVGG